MSRVPDHDERLLQAALAAQDVDSTGRPYDREAGLFEPASLTELRPLRRALKRGTSMAKLRLFGVRCPGPGSHLLCEVVAPGVLLTRHYALGDAADLAVRREDRDTDRHLGRVRIEPRQGPSRTVAAAAVLAELTLDPPPAPIDPATRLSSYRYGRRSLYLRCCMTVDLDTRWIADHVRAGDFRETVVPATMLGRTVSADVAAELDAFDTH